MFLGKFLRVGRSSVVAYSLVVAMVVQLTSGMVHAQAPVMTEFSAHTGTYPWGITSGPDGNMWFAESHGPNANKIARITTSGTITEFPLPDNTWYPYDITTGPDGNLWFTVDNGIGRMTPSGVVTKFPLPTDSSSAINGITVGSDGNLWFTDHSYATQHNNVVKITPSGTVTEYPLPQEASSTYDITTGADGNIWFTEYYSTGGKIGRMTPSGVLTEYTLPSNSAGGSIFPVGITKGPDGNVWFTESLTKIGKITPAGVITEYDTPAGGAKITTGPDGNLWIVEYHPNARIASMTTTGVLTEYPEVTGNPYLADIAPGTDGNVWFTEGNEDKIGRINLSSTTTPPSSGVPLLKQTDSQWQSNIYDSADKWSPSKPTIKTWGCALTSITMIMQYYGYHKLPDGTDLNPGTLNTWLKSQSDGYDKEGNVLWGAITRLSKQALQINHISAFDALEYKRIKSADKAQLTADLQNGQPDILEEPGHFIVATGISGNTFTVNDPARAITLLSDSKYNNTFVSLLRFVPSHTDLSYIMVASDPSQDVSIVDDQGNIVSSSFVQQPIAEPDDPTTHANPVKYTFVEQPGSGGYRVRTAGGSSDAALYVYDINGAVLTQGLSTGTGVFNVAYDKTDIQKTQVAQQPAVRINDGGIYTSNKRATLHMMPPFNAVSMRISNQSFSANQKAPHWQQFTSTAAWQLGGQNGQKTVYVQFKDASQHLSDIFSAHIILDTKKPYVESIIINNSSFMTKSPNIQVRLAARDGTSGIQSMKVSNGSDMSKVTWRPYQAMFSWSLIPLSGRTPQLRWVYVQLQDSAGNTSGVSRQAVVLLPE